MGYLQIQEMIDRVRWLGGSVNICYPESLPQAVVVIDWGLPLRKVSKTGYMPEILTEAADEFFHRVEMETRETEEDSHAA
jgi:hypothetical protein